MAKAFLKLDARRALKDGTYSVRIGVGHGTNLYLSTGVSVRLDDWDAKTQMCVGKGAKQLNAVLTAQLTRINARILELRENGKFYKLSKPQLKQMLSDFDMEVPSKEETPTLGIMFRRVIATKGERNAQLFTETLKKLEAYCDVDNVSFDEINRIWLDGFAASMRGLSVNTKAIHLRNLRNVVNYAIDESLTQNYPFRRFRIQTEETEMRVLPIETMRYYATATGLSKTAREYRDIFMLIFYLVGINIVDLSKLTPENIVNGRIEYRRSKTGKLYSIKIEPEAMEIIERHRGKTHLLACFDRYANYKDYAQHLNNGVRKIGPPAVDKAGKRKLSANNLPIMQPLEKEVTTYWARYSWATYAAEIGIPKDTISEALGHKYGSRITGVYIKFNRDKVDAANRAVIDYVLNL